MSRVVRRILVCGCILFLLAGHVARVSADIAEERARIQAVIKSYLSAYNSQDVEKLLAHWSPDGVFISLSDDERVVGHDQLKMAFAAIFTADNPPKMTAQTESISLISPNVALERGVATVTRSATDVLQSRYTVVLVKRDTKWLIDRITDDQLTPPPSNYKHLKELEWMLGEWTDVDDDRVMEVTAKWTKNANFISRRYSISNGSTEGDSTGLQLIGWDASQKRIRSWLFDSNGAVVTGTWTKSDDGWTVESVANLANGSKGSFTSIYRLNNDGTLRWRKINRVLDGHLLPNLDEVVVRRK